MANNGAVAALFVSMGIDTAEFSEGLKKAYSQAGNFGANFAAIGKSVALAGAAMAASAGAAFVTFGAQALTAADDIGDAAARIGISAEAFQKLGAAASAAGGTPELMTAALDKLNVGLGAFVQTGGGPAAKAFKDMGLASKIASGEIQTADQAFYAAAKAMEGIESPAEKARISMQLFGRAAGADMLEVLAAGEQGLKQYGEAAANSGRIMSNEMIEKLPAMKVKLDEAKLALSQMATVFAGQALISTEKFFDALGPAIQSVRNMAVQVGEFLRPSLEALGASMSKLASNQAFISFLKIVGTLIGGALVGGIRVAIQAFSAFINAINWVLAKLKPLYDGISQVFEAVAKATGRPVQPLKTFQNSVISASNTVSLEVPKVSKTFDRGTKSVAKSAESGAKAVDEYAKRIKDAFGTINTLMTPQEAAKQTTQKQLQDLNVLLKNGKITVDEWRKQMARVYEEEDAFIKKSAADRAKGALDRMNTRNEKPEWLSNVGSVKNNPNAGILASTDWIDKWKDGQTKAINDNDQLRDAFANTFSEGLSEALNGNSGNWLKSWWQKTMQNAFQNAANNAGKILFDLLNKSGGSSGSGGGGGIGDWARLAMQFFSKSPGFATGGSFKVGGSGGTDSKYIGMRLTPGEMVNVTKPGNDNGGQIMIPVSLGGEHIETIMVDIATRQATVVTGAALQGVSTAQARQKTYSRFAR